MSNDNNIAATLMDATYNGTHLMGWHNGERYRLRAIIKSKSKRVEIRQHDFPDAIKRYDSKEDFYQEWGNVKRLGECGWSKD